MSRQTPSLWQTKLAARLHDPGEKALILGRTREGHEGGTVRALREALFPQGVPEDVERLVRRADWWAAAADRPQWPRDLADRVDWTKEPVLIHPVSGKEIDLRQQGRLQEIDPEEIEEKSRIHFERLKKHCGEDLRKILLAFWRFGPELVEEEDQSKLGALWEQLPADTRVPDHSIWEHLDLASAFAGAFAAEALTPGPSPGGRGEEQGEVALLALSIGPVQPFIAAARSTSDLWAGSHLLSRLAWEAMRPLVEELGPDAVLFPRLRGIPQVDLWLRDQGLPDELFAGVPWKKSANADANPLFAAALPNRFVALVPAGQAERLAGKCRDAVRNYMQELGKKVVDRLLEAIGPAKDESLYCYQQTRRQLEGFPEVHWAAAPFSLVGVSADGKQVTDTVQLAEAMAPFFGVESGKPCGFLASPAWEVLQKEIVWDDGTHFFVPNPGVLYPAVYDLAERVLPAAKAVRPFEQRAEQGWRDSISGEAEWLTDNPEHLNVPAGKRRSRQDKRGFKEGEHVETLWTRVADKKPSWAKPGEHLSALSAIKRLWPTLFAEEVREKTGIDCSRFVVSTHTMALAHQLDRWLGQSGSTASGFAEEADRLKQERIALSTRIVRRHRDNPALEDARKLLAMMEEAQETENETKAARLRDIVRKSLATAWPEEKRGAFRLETYYGLLLMDGDRMGALLSEGGKVTFRESFHPAIRKQFDDKAKHNEKLKRYGNTARPPSPGRHMAISGALNDFALYVVPHVVQQEHLGRLIYGGGDDVLAMFPVADLLPAAARLRDAWSGTSRFAPAAGTDNERKRLKLENGFGWLDGKLLRMMGEHATASAGLVVAHHQAPLAAVLRELRAAERRAKALPGKDAWSLTVIKRSGGALYLTAKWGEPLVALIALREFLAAEEVSRRAVFNTQTWLHDLPEPERDGEMLQSLLAYQLSRQAREEAKSVAERLAQRLTALALAQPKARLAWLANFLSVAEFLSRETRTGSTKNKPSEEKERAA
ncbi:type III-B CRISPR-associated protein Cas10/Cmr2 [Pelomicrobium methylotrophicum]|uniref:Type III-B CRISPR-associated protein Cas10/Cmr2 n=1 Tax=Pelomicrobium methylotrophicum TaxID=2602750 RepID=A0A5C7ES45_9PROT|nr:type III-B CRISPR-associated protein Cas10/Cmr2 [Pelomicrobium methylotrophicum]TXF11482.1 type III-B CRISPR-associated protein Cas10/Cmr2 [Pelomicrobium methylotrophicum]